MIKVERYFCDSVPSNQEIEDAIRIATTQNKIIEIEYSAFNHIYYVRVLPSDTLKHVTDRIPKVFGL